MGNLSCQGFFIYLKTIKKKTLPRFKTPILGENVNLELGLEISKLSRGCCRHPWG